MSRKSFGVRVGNWCCKVIGYGCVIGAAVFGARGH